MRNFLLVEAHPPDLVLLEFAVRQADCNPISASSEADALVTLAQSHVDLIGIAFDDYGGGSLRFLRRIRERTSAPILVMSERTDRTFTVDALWAGADQVLAKPFFLDEFAAHVQALLRLAAEPQPPKYAAEASSENLEVQEDARRGNHRFSRDRSLSIKQFGRIRVNPFDKRVVVGTHVIDFTESEFIVIEALAANQGSIVHKEEMNLLLHGHPEMEKSKVVDVLLSRIRKKLADALGSNQVLIANYRGRGWSLELGEEPTNGASDE